MPDNWKNPGNAVSASSNASADNLEEAMCRLKIQTHDNQERVSVHASLYPDRPGEPDCIYYLRTGFCGYGNNCRFNHPVYGGEAALYRSELPERVGQPDCQYYLKTGACKFGASCKFNHPRDRLDAGQNQLNFLGLPMRQDEKPCPFYMRTGSCKFGVACKFHHPQPATLGAVFPVAGQGTYGSSGSSGPPSSGLPYLGGLPTWSLQRAPYISDAPIQGQQAYMPVVLSPQGIMPAQGWNTYMGTMTPLSTTNVLESNLSYNSNHQGESGSISTSVPNYPERPDQPECQYYMKNGSCKYGNTCKFHHPKDRTAPLATSTLGPFGLPSRPGQAICTNYSRFGICSYGPSCKFDHPFSGYYDYGMSLTPLSIPQPPPFSHQRNSPLAHSSENSPSRSRMQNIVTKSEGTSTKHENPEKKIPEDQQELHSSSIHSSPNSSESPQDQSD